MNNIINMNSQIKRIVTLDDTSKANELNKFLLSFETQDFPQRKGRGPRDCYSYLYTWTARNWSQTSAVYSVQ